MSHSVSIFRAAVLVGAVFAAACKDGTGPAPVPGLTVIASPEADTAGATPDQALTLEIRDDRGDPVRSGPVQLHALPLPIPPRCPFVCVEQAGVRILTPNPTGQATVVTGDRGRVSVRLRFGAAAGTARLAVSAAEGTVVDTVELTVLPGAATNLVLQPADTAIYLNTAAAVRASGVDRNGNFVPSPVTVASTTLPVSGTSVTGASYGTHKVAATLGTLRTEVTLTVVPRGTVATVTWPVRGEIRVWELDGTSTQTLRLEGGAEAFGIEWTPDGSALLVAAGSFSGTRELRRLAMDGTQPRFLASPQPVDALRPRYSADGQWVYFIGRTTTYEPQVMRARADGTGAEVMPNIAWAEVVAPSHDGSRFAWSSRAGASELNVYDVPTGTTRSLGMRASAVLWSPVTDRLAYTSQYLTLGFVGPDGGLPVVIGGEPAWGADHGPLDWSPDGEWVVFGWHEELWLRQVSTGLEFRIPRLTGIHPNWK